jgi:two-component system, response regulator YesN
VVRNLAAAARHFALVARIDTVALEPVLSGETAPATTRSCSVCDAALRGHEVPVTTDATHGFAAYQAERLGGRYVYVCPHGLLHVAAPVIADDEIRALLVCGPAVLGAVDDEAVRALCESSVGSLLPPESVVAWVASLPRLAPDEATALSHTLRSVALSLCDASGADYLRRNATEMTEYLDHLSTMEGEFPGAPRYPLETERELLDRVTAGDRAGACALLEHITRAVTASAASGVSTATGASDADRVDEVRSRVLELVVLLSRAAIAGGADAEEVFGLEYRSLIRLRSLGTADEVVAWLNRILRRFVDLVFDLRHVRYSAHLARALGFAREYYREPIQLGDAAAAAGVSPGYLGRIIRSELRTTWNAYLAGIRLQEAKRLLRSTRLPVGEVASLCGFPDQSYFAQVFRREFGVSPVEFRVHGGMR